MDVNQNDLKRRFHSLSDEKIIEVYKKRKDLTKIAQTVLRTELKERGLTGNKIEKIIKHGKQDNGKREDVKDTIPEKQTSNSNTIENICNQYKAGSILWWRALATAIDFIVFLLLFLIFITFIKLNLELVGLSIIIFYYILGEWKFGKTVGKYFAKIRVVNIYGERPTFLQVVLRTAFRFLEVKPALAGGIPAGIIMCLNKKKQRIGDIIAKTYIIRDADYDKKSVASDYNKFGFTAS